MAHMITINSLTGKTEATYARPAWHSLGTIVTGDLTRDNFFANSPLLGWNQTKEQTFIEKNGQRILCPDNYAILRNDTNQILGNVGARFEIFQNEEMIDLLEALRVDGLVEYESAFSMFDSTKVVIVARLPGHDFIAEQDSIVKYCMVSAAHDGTCAIRVTPTAIRPVCWNTVSLALRNGKSLTRSMRHTPNLQERVEEMKEYLRSFDPAFQAHIEGARTMQAKKYDDQMFAAYMNTLYPAPADDASTRMKNLYAQSTEHLQMAFAHPTNNLPSMVGTIWQMYNVVTYATDHLSNGFHKEENNIDSLLFGKKDEFKQRAFELALQMAS